MAYSDTLIGRAMNGEYDNENSFTNSNKIKKLAGEINMIDIISPTSAVCGKLMEIVARAKCLKDFELLPDGHLLYNKPSRAESPEGDGQARVKT
tara:strand:+ start:30 stop:311 length:282 start_codon:yes stop_codon:yes gene_type:complete